MPWRELAGYTVCSRARAFAPHPNSRIHRARAGRFASDPMSAAESLEEVHLSDMSAEGKREQQALMRGKSSSTNLSLGRVKIAWNAFAAPQEEVPPTGCGATACAGVLVVVSIFFMVITFPFSLLYVIKVDKN